VKYEGADKGLYCAQRKRMQVVLVLPIALELVAPVHNDLRPIELVVQSFPTSRCQNHNLDFENYH